MADQKGLKNISYLTKEIHVWPDFHGNRSPLADPTLKGMVKIFFYAFKNRSFHKLLSLNIMQVSGLSLSVDKENLALYYLATVQALTV